MKKRLICLLTTIVLLLSMATLSIFADATDVNILLVKSSAVKKTGVELKWNVIPDATKYVVYGNLCGNEYKKLKTVSKSNFTVKKINGKALRAHKTYKFYVAAYNDDKRIAKSKSVHCITARTAGKYGNVKSIKSAIKSLDMNRSDTYQLSIKKTIVAGKKHLPKSHGAATRYYSTDNAIATVDKKGLVSAKGVGTATIYAQDTGGKYTAITVTVNPGGGLMLGATSSGSGPLCFTAVTNRSSVSMEELYGEPAGLLYSTDGRNWKDFVIGVTTVPLNHIGQKAYFKAVNTNDAINGCFVMTGRIAASGNVMSLLDSTCNSTAITEDAAFRSLFNGCTSLTCAPGLPAETLSDFCYEKMFAGCKNLFTAPELPATQLAVGCYQSMFQNCGELDGIKLPATELADHCYAYMFNGCKGIYLEDENSLPVSTLKKYCYEYMFRNCGNIINAPTRLPATHLTEGCYKGMYSGSGIETTPAMAVASISKASCEEMFRDCINLKSAGNVSLGAGLGIAMSESSCKAMFRGCTALTTVPSLVIGNTATSCCESMYEGCSNLVEARHNLSTTTANSCYKKMFAYCGKLTNIQQLPAVTLSPFCYEEMFIGCACLKSLTVNFRGDASKSSLAYIKGWLDKVPAGTFYCPSDILEDYIPEGWKVVHK